MDVQIEDDVIYHYCSSGFLSGEVVHGEIDWDHRFNNMQQHTGEHIFTGLAHNIYGAENVGFHLSENTVTLDLNIELSVGFISNTFSSLKLFIIFYNIFRFFSSRYQNINLKNCS